MNTTRFEIIWLPTTAADRIYDKHRAAIESRDASLWDFIEPDDLEVVEYTDTREDAFARALAVQPLDYFGEVFIYEQRLLPDEEDGQPDWLSVNRALVEEPDQTELEWEPV